MTASALPAELIEIGGMAFAPAYLSAGIALVAAFLFALSAHIQNMGPKSASTQFGTLILICLMAALVGFLMFPEQIAHLTGSEKWLEMLRKAYPLLPQ